MVATGDGDPFTPYRRDSRQVEVVARQDLHIDGGDAELYGELYVPASGAGIDPPYPGVLVCHGLTSNCSEVRQAASTLARHGLVAMIFDFRGHGRSGGVCDRSQHLDVLYALRHLRQLPELDCNRVGLVGHSSGARAALLAASQSQDVAAVVSLSLAPDDMAREMAGADDALGGDKRSVFWWGSVGLRLLFSGMRAGPRRLLQVAVLLMRLPHLRINWTKTATAWAEWGLAQALSAMRPRPVLFVHCQGDWATPPAASIDAYRACPAPKELWLEPGGFHSTPLQSAALRERWSDWLSQRLSR